MGFYNRSPNELKELSLMINRLDTRAENLRKELVKNLLYSMPIEAHGGMWLVSRI